jgi:selenocysteine lyase/cysteine desulfurase
VGRNLTVNQFEKLCGLIRQNEVGRRARIDTPFGRRLLCYADLTATGRHLHFVEAWMRHTQAFYANSHTAVSTTGRIMTELREEARRVVLRSVNAASDDIALFTGAGATAAVNKLVGLLGWRISEPLERKYQLSRHIPATERPVVFVGPYEHHSNELPWLESVAEVVDIELDPSGGVDLGDLERKLARYAHRPDKLGAFSAASNVTGVLSDVGAIAQVLHRHGALACFDFAAAGPYVPIDMHPKAPGAHLDAVYLSPHKFIGGPHASGLLVANRAMFRTRTPERPGGGTVEFVCGFDKGSVDYARRLDEREEGGTPAIEGDFRVGVAFLVKEMLGPKEIYEHEVRSAAMAVERLSRHPRIRVLGPKTLPRLGIISLNVDGLHHDLVSVLLDHLFGIQNRAGCSCAGPYGLKLLGLTREQASVFREQLSRGLTGLKPGWVRISLPYYATDEDLDFILRAVEFVADRGDAFLPAYRLGWLDGVWRHVASPRNDIKPIELTVDALLEAAQHFGAGDHEQPLTEAQLKAERAQYFEQAHQTATALEQRWAVERPTYNPPTGVPEVDSSVWFKFVHADAPWDRVLPRGQGGRPTNCWPDEPPPVTA